MKKDIIIKKISDSITEAQKNEILYKNIFLNPEIQDFKHEFLFFIKPELTSEINASNQKSIYEMLFDKFDLFNFYIKSINIIGSTYLEKYDIISNHYGVINALSRQPREFLTEEAKAKFNSAYDCDYENACIIGSLQFLNKHKEYDAYSLDELWQKSNTTKLAGGAYCAEIIMNNEKIYLINGFHPKQLIHFTEKGKSIISFHLCSNIDWSESRNNFIGKTNPADALKGSLRNELLVKKDNFGLETVSSSKNGFHLSAGPVEAVVELIRYTSNYSDNIVKSPSDFKFGRQLLSLFTKEEVDKICSNTAVIYKGSKINTFDLTEEKNNDTALNILKESRLLL